MNDNTGEAPITDIEKALRFLSGPETEEIIKGLEQNNEIIIKEEEEGLVMISAQDHSGSGFYAGELLVTRAEVVCSGIRGFGMIAGSSKGHARILACLDAAGRAGNKNITDFIITKTRAAMNRFYDETAKENIFTASTKVNFGLMAEG